MPASEHIAPSLHWQALCEHSPQIRDCGEGWSVRPERCRMDAGTYPSPPATAPSVRSVTQHLYGCSPINPRQLRSCLVDVSLPHSQSRPLSFLEIAHDLPVSLKHLLSRMAGTVEWEGSGRAGICRLPSGNTVSWGRIGGSERRQFAPSLHRGRGLGKGLGSGRICPFPAPLARIREAGTRGTGGGLGRTCSHGPPAAESKSVLTQMS